MVEHRDRARRRRAGAVLQREVEAGVHRHHAHARRAKHFTTADHASVHASQTASDVFIMQCTCFESQTAVLAHAAAALNPVREQPGRGGDEDPPSRYPRDDKATAARAYQQVPARDARRRSTTCTHHSWNTRSTALPLMARPRLQEPPTVHTMYGALARSAYGSASLPGSTLSRFRTCNDDTIPDSHTQYICRVYNVAASIKLEPAAQWPDWSSRVRRSAITNVSRGVLNIFWWCAVTHARAPARR